jgi:mono/diheme cytochrome c family protein
VKRSTRIGTLLFLVGLGVAGYYLFTGPYMLVQPHIRAFQAEMPPTPEGVVPVVSPYPPLPTTRQATTMPNLLFVNRSPTAADYAAGKTYYEYYGCLACHGAAGDGRGPVGESYVPAPTDLRAAKFRDYSDGQLLRASLTGIGHEPVLERTVLAEHRWLLVLYVRSLSAP